jgi:hypothetical protein
MAVAVAVALAVTMTKDGGGRCIEHGGSPRRKN